MSAIVDPTGRPASSDPVEQELDTAIERARRGLCACLYGAGPPGTILDERGQPVRPARSGLSEWIP